MTADGVIALFKGKKMGEGEFKLILRTYLETNIHKALDIHTRKTQSKREEFRRRKVKLREEENREALDLLLQFNYEQEKRRLYGLRWDEKIGYGE